MSAEDRAEAVAFAESQVGARYGYWEFLSIAISVLTGGKFVFALDGTFICSGLVARAQERGKAIFVDPDHTMPADLAKAYTVPRPGTPR
jgi:uncharacterized protein YycO